MIIMVSDLEMHDMDPKESILIDLINITLYISTIIIIIMLTHYIFFSHFSKLFLVDRNENE